MCQVIAYWRLKTIENSKTFRKKVVEVAFGRWSFTRVFRLRPLTEDIFGVLRRWSLIGGGRLQEVVARGHSTGRMNYFI